MKKNKLSNANGSDDADEELLQELRIVDNGNSNITNKRKAYTIRVFTNKEILRSTRRLDRFLSLLNEDETSLLANSKIAERVEVSTAQWTKEKLIDMISQNLAEVCITIEQKHELINEHNIWLEQELARITEEYQRRTGITVVENEKRK